MKTDLSKSVIYQVYPRTFTAEGTLKAAEKLIPHLHDLGIDIIYMSACNTEDTSKEGLSPRQIASGTGNVKNPYRITDYFNVDEEYGTIDDLKDFVTTAHEYELKVLIDLVYLHCGPKAVFHEEHPEFVLRDETGKIISGKDWPFARFNYAEKSLREYLWSNMEFYIKEVKADGFRCDVGDQVPLDFWAEGIKRIKDINPDVIMLNEGSDCSYLKEFDINYGMFTINALNNVFLDAEDVRLGKEISPDRTHMTVDEFKKLFSDTYVGVPDGKFILINSQNHDTASDFAERRPDVHLGYNAGTAILTLVFTMKGIPMIYNGDEVFDTLPKNMFWNRFCDGNMSIEWQMLDTEEGRNRLEIVKKLISLHRFNDVISCGNFNWYEEECDENIIAFVRKFKDTEETVMVNVGRTQQKAALNKPGKIIFANNANIVKNSVVLDEYGALIIEN